MGTQTSCYTFHMVRRALNRLFHRLDDLSVRSKLILSYVLGFLLPLTLISLAAWMILTTQARRADERQAQASLTLMQNQLSASLHATTRLAGLLSTDQQVRTALDDWRIDRVGHLVQYRLQLHSYLNSFVTAYPQVTRLEFYTSNPAVVRGGAVLLIDEDAKESEWMRSMIETGSPTASVLHVDQSVLTIQRALSLIRYMGEHTTDGPRIEHYLRIDIALAEVRDIIQRSGALGTVFLVDHTDRVAVGNAGAGNDFTVLTPLADVAPQQKDLITIEAPVATSGPFANLRLVGYFPYSSTWSLSAHLTASAVLLGIASIVLASLIQLGIGHSLFRRLQLLTRRITEAGRGHFPVVTEKPGNDELGTLIVAYNDMTTTIDRLLKEVYQEGLTVNRLAVEKRHAELEALISKIDPHFLSNSLNTIRMKSLGRREVETANALKALGRLFDYMTAWQDETILVRQELEFISGFLELQRYRFGKDYEFDVETDPATLDLPIPRMLVQPIVENASKHGIEQQKKRGRISVTFAKRGDRLEIVVSDNGRGMDHETLAVQRARLGERSKNGESIGLQNVYNRLLLIFGEDADFSLDSEPGVGTTVHVSFSYQRLESDVESHSR